MKLNMDSLLKEEQENKLKQERRANGGRKKFNSDENIWYNLTEGSHQLRILPPGYGDEMYIPNGGFGMVVYDHWNPPGFKGEARDGKFRCPSRSFPESGIDCPVCKAMSKLYDHCDSNDIGDADKKRMIGKHGLRGRAYVNAIVRDSTEESTVDFKGESVTIPKIWSVGLPMSVYGFIRESAVRKNAKGNFLIGDFTDVSKGYDVIVTRTGEGLDTKYDVMFDPEGKSPLLDSEDVAEATQSAGHNFGKMFKHPTEEDLQRGKTLADGVISLLARSGDFFDERGSEVASAQPKATFTGSRPECFGFHVALLTKCMICPVEVNCQHDESTMSRSLEERQQRHEAAVPF